MMRKRLVIAMSASYAALLLAGCSKVPPPETDACVARGVAYFKEIGSYPTLQSSGESADRVARERCARTTTAF